MFAVVYTKDACQPCKATKRHLTGLNAPWVEIPITPELASEFSTQGFKSAPIVEIYEDDEEYFEFGESWAIERFSGYQPGLLNDYFERRNFEDLKKEIGLV